MLILHSDISLKTHRTPEPYPRFIWRTTIIRRENLSKWLCELCRRDETGECKLAWVWELYNCFFFLFLFFLCHGSWEQAHINKRDTNKLVRPLRFLKGGDTSRTSHQSRNVGRLDFWHDIFGNSLKEPRFHVTSPAMDKVIHHRKPTVNREHLRYESSGRNLLQTHRWDVFKLTRSPVMPDICLRECTVAIVPCTTLCLLFIHVRGLESL